MTTTTTRVATLCCLAALAAGGCQTRAPKRSADANVGVAMIPAPDAPSLELQSHQRFQMASSTFEPLPAYPPERLHAQADAASVCVEIIVDAEGQVASAEASYALPDCPQSAEQLPEAFASAALDAIRRWQFIPAEICEFPPGVETNSHCSGAGVTLRAIPIRLAYVFSFAVIDGQAQVLTRTSNARR